MSTVRSVSVYTLPYFAPMAIRCNNIDIMSSWINQWVCRSWFHDVPWYSMFIHVRTCRNLDRNQSLLLYIRSWGDMASSGGVAPPSGGGVGAAVGSAALHGAQRGAAIAQKGVVNLTIYVQRRHFLRSTVPTDINRLEWGIYGIQEDRFINNHI